MFLISATMWVYSVCGEDNRCLGCDNGKKTPEHKTATNCAFYIHFFFTFIYLPEKFVMTSQQFKKELQESGGVNEIFIPQKNESFAEGLKQTENRLRNAFF